MCSRQAAFIYLTLFLTTSFQGHFQQRPHPHSQFLGLRAWCPLSFQSMNFLICKMNLLLFSCSVMSNSWWPNVLQHTMLPWPSPSPRICSNSCPLSQWCHPTISSSVVPFSSCLQSFSASGPFPMSWFFTSCGQSIGASASVFPMNVQDWLPLGLTGLISLQSKGLSRIFSNNTVRKHWMKVKWWGLRKYCWLIALCQVCSHIVSLSPNFIISWSRSFIQLSQYWMPTMF